jgi:hypothetical protein
LNGVASGLIIDLCRQYSRPEDAERKQQNNKHSSVMFALHKLSLCQAV